MSVQSFPVVPLGGGQAAADHVDVFERSIPARFRFLLAPCYSATMRRDDAIARLRENESAIRALGAASLYLFGSVARDEARADSDVDVFIDRDPARKFTFIELLDLGDLLQNVLGAKVDVTTRGGLHPRLKDRIERSSVKVF
jgi:hypothetical protein